jgi:hypothetical protein
MPSNGGKTMQSFPEGVRVAVPLALIVGVLPACGDNSKLEVELRNHAGATYSFLVSNIHYPELSDYDLISLYSFSATLDHDETVPFEIKLLEAEDFKGGQRISRVGLSVSVLGTGAEDPPVFSRTLEVGGNGTPWLDLVVRDDGFHLAQGRD